MWSVQSDKIKQYKKRVNYTINKHTIDRFKIVADKDMRKMSNIAKLNQTICEEWGLIFSKFINSFSNLFISINIIVSM